jgi:hypothetical protein
MSTAVDTRTGPTTLLMKTPPNVPHACEACGERLSVRLWHNDACFYCPPCQRVSVRDLAMEAWAGLVKYRYPLCCVLHYLWDSRKGEPPAVKRNAPPDREIRHVPCALCVRRGRT